MLSFLNDFLALIRHLILLHILLRQWAIFQVKSIVYIENEANTSVNGTETVLRWEQIKRNVNK